jgi:hypothetical protein
MEISMTRIATLLVVLALALTSTSLAQTTRDAKTDALADAVMSASGAANWPKVKRIAFTFNVEKDGKSLVSAKHEWDMKAGTDTVTWGGKTVTINIMGPHEGDDAKAAFQRWTNDSYWLLAPLKLHDGGAMLSYGGEQEIEGTKYEILNMSFAGVGLTPGDHYMLYIDPQSHLLQRWDYMPKPDQKTSGTWEKYEKFDGLTLSMDHHFGDKRIFFTDVKVEE